MINHQERIVIGKKQNEKNEKKRKERSFVHPEFILKKNFCIIFIMGKPFLRNLVMTKNVYDQGITATFFFKKKLWRLFVYERLGKTSLPYNNGPQSGCRSLKKK